MRNSILTFFLFFILGNSTLLAQNEMLQSGPMVGYSTMKEVSLWVQTTQPALVHFVYWNVKTPAKQMTTEPVTTQKENAFIANVIADRLEPSQQYEYELFINEEKVNRPYSLKFESQPIWLWRTDAPDFSFAIGSCNYVNEPKYDRPGKPYGSNHQIFNHIVNQKPNFMVWMGDNFYLREADWNSPSGIFHRYTHTRSLPEMQSVLGSMHHYAIWDDHDFGPNNSDRSFPLKRTTEKAFKLFFPRNNYIFDEGVTSHFQWADCEFFLMDNRYWRTPNKRTDIENPKILGDRQVEWLLDALVNSYAPFKFIVVGGQFVNPLVQGESHIKCAPEERAYLIRKIKELKINGVIFLTGDVHHTELSKLDMEGGYPLYDLTVSPLTAGAYGDKAEENPTHVKGTLVKENSFGELKITGSKDERKLTVTTFNSEGKVQWTKEIKAADLKFKKE